MSAKCCPVITEQLILTVPGLLSITFTYYCESIY